MSANLKWVVLLILFCIPLLWLGVKDSHDWSDDGDGYIRQAQNICEGKSQAETGYVFNPRYVFMGPPAYTIGFPLLLAPIYLLFGHSIYAYLFFMSVLLLFFVLLLFVFLGDRIKPLYAFLFCLLIAYNPYTIYLKSEIMCDVCTALFLLLIIVCFERWKNKTELIYPLLLALLNGWLLSIKGSGVAISIALILMLPILLLQNKTGRRRVVFKNTFIVVVGGMAFYYLLNSLLFPIPNGGVSFYISIAKVGNYFNTLLSNLDNYVNRFTNFFTPEMEQWKAMAKITAAFMLSFTVCGFALKAIKRIELTEVVFATYVLIILLYPYPAGIRIVFPLLPFACYYIYLTAQQLTLNFKHKQLLAISITIIILLQYRTMIEKIIDNSHQITEGPQRASAQVAFQYIRNHTPKQAIFNFRRPRALARYTHRKACCSFPWDQPNEVLNNIDSLKVSYCMTNTTDVNPALDSLIKIKPLLFKKVWNNEQFVIYKFR